MKYLIKYGVGGGYNDADNYEIVERQTKQAAENLAYERAIETFESYDVQMEADEDDEEAWNEERDTWLEYSAELYDAEKHKDIEINK